jgi:putative SOS response-associated peptidase YedK
MFTWEQVHAFLCLQYLRGPVAEALFEQRFNVAPSQTVNVVRASGDGEACELAPMRWGLVPSWSKDGKPGPINARCETVQTNGLFRTAFKKRRCIVPVSGFYEWQQLEGRERKQPWYFFPASDPLFALAGLWESRGEGSERVDTFTLVTTPANELIAPLHDRMPLILPRDVHATWVFGTPDAAAKLMLPLPGTAMAAHQVSDRVNRPREQGAQLIEPIAG